MAERLFPKMIRCQILANIHIPPEIIRILVIRFVIFLDAVGTNRWHAKVCDGTDMVER